MEESHVPLVVPDTNGQTAAELALSTGHKEINSYLCTCINNVFEKHKSVLEEHITKELEGKLAAPLANLQELAAGAGIQLPNWTPENWSNQFLANFQGAVQGNNYPPLPTQTIDQNDTALQQDIDDFLEGMREGLQEQLGTVPEPYRNGLKDFDITGLRPYAAAFVQQCRNQTNSAPSPEPVEKVQKDLSGGPEGKGALEKPDDKEPQKQFSSNVSIIIEPKEELKLEREEPNLERRYVPTKQIIKSYFIPDDRTNHIEYLRDDIQHLKEVLEELDQDVENKLDQKVERKYIGGLIATLYKDIRVEKKELKRLYRDLKNIAHHRGADNLILREHISINQPNSEQGQTNQYSEKEIDHLTSIQKKAELAGKLLKELQEVKQVYQQFFEENRPLLEKHHIAPTRSKKRI